MKKITQLFVLLFPMLLLGQQITSLDKLKMEEHMYFKSSTGHSYIVWQYKGSCDAGEHETSETGDIDENNKSCNGADFDGKARLKAKVSFAEGSEEKVSNYRKFINDLESDEVMCQDLKASKIQDRDPREMKNVKVQGLWLYAFKRQKDEDYHLMVGTTGIYEKDLEKGFYNIEISGNPSKNHMDYKDIKKARMTFEEFFGISECSPVCRNYVDFYLNPIKIVITGSIFYDTDHCTNPAHPKDYPIHTAWEIHPIRSIEFIE